MLLSEKISNLNKCDYLYPNIPENEESYYEGFNLAIETLSVLDFDSFTKEELEEKVRNEYIKTNRHYYYPDNELDSIEGRNSALDEVLEVIENHYFDGGL